MRIEGFYPTGYTSVPHSFIDRYMISANGEFVKTYLLLLRISESGDFSVPDLADKLQQTEKDVHRALKFWASQGLLRVVEKDQEIESVSVLFPPAEFSQEGGFSAAGSQDGQKEAAPAAGAPARSGGKNYSARELKALKEKQDFDQLLFALEHYLGRTLSPRDVDIMAYLYDGLGFPGEVLEYLAEYCVDRWEREDKKLDYHLMRYMETVALNWHSRGAVTLEKAKQQTAQFALESASYGAVAKALGLKNRQLTDKECRRVNAWMDELKMPQELILEACERTIRKKNTPDFRYIEGILKSWQKEGIASLKALDAWEEARPKKEETKDAKGEEDYLRSLKEADYTKLLRKKD